MQGEEGRETDCIWQFKVGDTVGAGVNARQCNAMSDKCVTSGNALVERRMRPLLTITVYQWRTIRACLKQLPPPHKKHPPSSPETGTRNPFPSQRLLEAQAVIPSPPPPGRPLLTNSAGQGAEPLISPSLRPLPTPAVVTTLAPLATPYSPTAQAELPSLPLPSSPDPTPTPFLTDSTGQGAERHFLYTPSSSRPPPQAPSLRNPVLTDSTGQGAERHEGHLMNSAAEEQELAQVAQVWGVHLVLQGEVGATMGGAQHDGASCMVASCTVSCKAQQGAAIT